MAINPTHVKNSFPSFWNDGAVISAEFDGTWKLDGAKNGFFLPEVGKPITCDTGVWLLRPSFDTRRFTFYEVLPDVTFGGAGILLEGAITFYQDGSWECGGPVRFFG